MTDTVRANLERALESCGTQQPRTGDRQVVHGLITEALALLDERERDHEAMEALRFASLRRGFQWRWDGMDLQQTSDPTVSGRYKDPTDAIRNPQEPTDG